MEAKQNTTEGNFGLGKKIKKEISRTNKNESSIYQNQ